MSLRLLLVAVIAVIVGFVFVTRETPVSEASANLPPTAQPAAAIGDTVVIHYTGKTADGDVFEQTEPDRPRGIVIGSEQVMPALEQALVGMQVGESRRIEIDSDEAFGPYRDEPGMKTRLMRAALSHRLDPYVGMRLNAAVFADEKATEPTHVPVTVVEVTNEYLIVDANHPLAGKDLVFEVEVIDVIRAVD